MKLKKMALILSLVMAASMMTACGNSDSGSDDEDENDTASVAAQDEDDEDDGEEDSEAAEPADESSEASDTVSDDGAESSAESSLADESSAVDDSAAAAQALEEILASDVNDSVEISENLFDFEVAVDGVKFTFPTDYATLNGSGWEFDGDIEQGIPNGSYLLAAHYFKDDSYISTNPANFVSDTDVKVKDSTTYQCYFQINDDYHQTRSAVKLPKDIKLGISTMDEVKAAYGDPTVEEEEDEYGLVEISYQDSYMVFWDFYFNSEGTLVGAKLCNMKDVV